MFTLTLWLRKPLQNRLDPDQAQQNVGCGLDPNYLTYDGMLQMFFKKIILKKIAVNIFTKGIHV